VTSIPCLLIKCMLVSRACEDLGILNSVGLQGVLAGAGPVFEFAAEHILSFETEYKALE